MRPPRFASAAVAGLAVWLMCACTPQPKVETSVSMPSGAANTYASIAEVDNGLGFGLGEVRDEVHVHTGSALPTSLADSSESVVFLLRSRSRGTPGTTIRWVSPNELEIEYPVDLQPSKQLHASLGITIKYKVRAAAQ